MLYVRLIRGFFSPFFFRGGDYSSLGGRSPTTGAQGADGAILRIEGAIGAANKKL